MQIARRLPESSAVKRMLACYAFAHIMHDRAHLMRHNLIWKAVVKPKGMQLELNMLSRVHLRPLYTISADAHRARFCVSGSHGHSFSDQAPLGEHGPRVCKILQD